MVSYKIKELKQILILEYSIMKNCYLFTILLLSLVRVLSKPQYLLIDEQIQNMSPLQQFHW
jgi:hypothetical protein